MTFKEFIRMQEDVAPAPVMSASPNVKQNTVKTLQNVSRLPVPSGVNPSLYKQKLMAAMNVARQGNAANAADAVNTVNVQQSLQQT